MTRFQILVLRALRCIITGMMHLNPNGTASYWYESAGKLVSDIDSETQK